MSTHKCPECKTELAPIKGIGLVCPTRTCPVNDDALLWDGDGNRKDPPKITVPDDSAARLHALEKAVCVYIRENLISDFETDAEAVAYMLTFALDE